MAEDLKWEDPWTPEKIWALTERWRLARAELTKMEERPPFFVGLIHDGNRAENMTRISMGQDQERSLRVRWAQELSWFARFAEYLLEKENEVMTLKISKQVLFDMLVEAYVDELSVDRGQAHAMIAFDFENNLAAQDLP